jgi:hypothetical protein
MVDDACAAGEGSKDDSYLPARPHSSFGGNENRLLRIAWKGEPEAAKKSLADTWHGSKVRRGLGTFGEPCL